MGLISGWATKGIYVHKFTDRIKKDVLDPAYNRLIFESDIIHDKQPQKYSKTFIADYRLLQ